MADCQLVTGAELEAELELATGLRVKLIDFKARLCAARYLKEFLLIINQYFNYNSMPKDLNGRPYALVKTGIEDLEKISQVRQTLVRQTNIDRLQQRARIRRQFPSPPLSRPVVTSQSTTPKISDSPYRVIRYDPDSDLWQVQSLTNPSEQFLARAIKSGAIEVGSLVRGYPPNAIEPRSQGRRFKPVEDPITQLKKEIVISINIGYTGRDQ